MPKVLPKLPRECFQLPYSQKDPIHQANENKPEFLKRREQARAQATRTANQKKKPAHAELLDALSSENESDESEPEPEVEFKSRFNRGRRRQLVAKPQLKIQSFQEPVVRRDLEQERKKKEEEEAKKRKAEEEVEKKKVNIFQPAYLVQPKQKEAKPEPTTVKTRASTLFQPNFKPQPGGGRPGRTAPTVAMPPTQSNIKTDLQAREMQSQNSMSMFSNVKPEAPRKVTNQEIQEHLDMVMCRKRSVDSFIKEKYFKKKNWVCKYLIVKLDCDLALQMIEAETKAHGHVRGLRDAITVILKEATEHHKAKYADSSVTTEFSPIDCSKLDFLATLCYVFK